MAEAILLDSGPLGKLVHPEEDQSREIADWFAFLQERGAEFVVPEIIEFELRRAINLIEINRFQKRVDKIKEEDRKKSLERLDEFCQAGNIHRLPLTPEVLRRAAQFWAMERRIGRQSKPDPALEIDLILAAQAESLDGIVATDDLRHLSRFGRAHLWHNIMPRSQRPRRSKEMELDDETCHNDMVRFKPEVVAAEPLCVGVIAPALESRFGNVVSALCSTINRECTFDHLSETAWATGKEPCVDPSAVEKLDLLIILDNGYKAQRPLMRKLIAQAAEKFDIAAKTFLIAPEGVEAGYEAGSLARIERVFLKRTRRTKRKKPSMADAMVSECQQIIERVKTQKLVVRSRRYVNKAGR